MNPRRQGGCTVSTTRRRRISACNCWRARRFVERGVRFIQIQHGAGGAGYWDAHGSLKYNHGTNCRAVDKPIAGLLKDLKRRGLLDETIVLFASEFGRTPGSQGSDGRDHHIYGFSVWMAGGGSRAASSTAGRTRSASTPSRTGTTLPTSTRRSCTSSASTRASSRCPAASASTSTTASRSRRSLLECGWLVRRQTSGVWF